MAVRYGLKVWSDNTGILDSARILIDEGLFHYLEITPVPGTDRAAFVESGLPFIIHVTTERWGFNIADQDKEEFNRKILGECISWADSLDAEILILHPGYGYLSAAENFLSREEDPRIVIENMPVTGLSGEPMVGYSPGQIRRLRGERFGFCLDLNHAVKAAVSQKMDYRALIREFLALKPLVFHIADGTLANEKDEHLPIGAGEYDIPFLKRCIEEQPGAFLTIETPRPSGTLRDDRENLERFASAQDRSGDRKV
jgi:endonuclease IV